MGCLISADDEEFIAKTALARPAKLGRPFTHWSIRKLADYLATDARPDGADRAGTAPADLASSRYLFPADPDLEGVA